MSKGYRKYTPEFREEVVKLVIDTSRAITDVAREYGVHDAQNNGIYDAEPRDPASAAPTSFRQWCQDTLKPAVQA